MPLDGLLGHEGLTPDLPVKGIIASSIALLQVGILWNRSFRKDEKEYRVSSILMHYVLEFYLAVLLRVGNKLDTQFVM